MKVKRISIVSAIMILCTCLAGTAKAQGAFKQGDEYSKTTYIHASGVLQRGSQQYNINTASSISKTYRVTGTTSDGVILTVTTTRITDTVDAFGKKLTYDSGKLVDTGSYIQVALQSLVGKVVTLSINKNGIITDVNDPDGKFATDTLMAFAGFNQDKFVAGKRLDLFADYQSPKKSGESWVSNSSVDDEKISTTYTVGIADEPEKYTNLLITSTTTAGDQNSNTNGVLIVDNWGVIIRGAMKTATVSYKLINNAPYAFSRLTEVLESCKKIN
ncbi:hypothetical protein AAFN85_30655 [Mucilaginibacter sp. CAU 1740]|uniref:hypothetical protein n=1 Tax=Mucilaginibacter sp. CAU 1740 TaxID=3140365 RepID=UPI00325BCC30